MAIEFTEVCEEISDRREVWIAGDATPKFIRGLEMLGWTVRPDVSRDFLPSIPWGVE